MDVQVFKSEVDGIFIAAFAIAWLIVFLPLLIPRIRKASPALPIIVAFAALPVVVMPLWLLFTTRYTVSATEMNIRSGPVDFSIPLDAIESVTPTRDAASSPALSLDRLEIRYGGGKRVLVSPENREEFIRRIDAARNSAAR